MHPNDAHEWRTCLTYLLDPSVSEVETNGPNEFFIKKSGKRIHLSDIRLEDEVRYREGIEAGLLPHTRPVDLAPGEQPSLGNYLYEAPLHLKTRDQLVRGRVHIVLPPAADSPQITIAKKSTSLVSLEAIASKGSMAGEMLTFMKAAMAASLTICFSGGTGAGKTTMLEACSKLIPDSVRIGVAEDTPELSLAQPNVTYLHSFPWRPGMDPKDVANLDWVVAQFQRMRTDRLIVGETRGSEFAGFLTAANSGMEGSLTTIHANTPRRCLDKMSNFALRGSERQPVRAINQDIANAIDIIVQLIILPDGRHKMASITEITTTIGDSEAAAIVPNELYAYDIAQDVFIKKGQMQDALRKRLENKGIDLAPLLATRPGQVVPVMDAGAPSRATTPSAPVANRGLPIPSRQIP